MQTTKRDVYTQATCFTPGCNNLQVATNHNYRGTGRTHYRKWCRQCHDTRTGAKHGLKNVAQVVAMNAGFDSVADYVNSTHPYRKHRKNYCENIDGRLNFKCTYPKKPFKEFSALLQVDHIDGNPDNNHPDNLQTLCPNCHTVKTHMFGDCKTPGRKSIKEAKNC